MRLILGDSREVLKTLPDNSIQCVVTSPPYWGLRDYGVDGQLGLERTPEEYVSNLVAVFHEVRRVLREDGTLWLNLGDSYAGGSGCHEGGSNKQNSNSGATNSFIPPKTSNGLKPKDLVGIPWRVAFALQQDGWYLRSDIIWHKPNPMPESVTDRPTKSHEYIFLLTKAARYYYDSQAISEDSIHAGEVVINNNGKNGQMGIHGQTRTGFLIDGGIVVKPVRNRRSVWTVATSPYKEAHFATYPPKLIEPCILAGSKPGDVVLDPFNGAGTTGLVALQNGRDYIGIELNPDYIALTEKRLENIQVRLA